KILGIEDRYDLALLKIDAKGLRPIVWASSKTAEVGNWLATAGTGKDPVAIGVVSVATRKPGRRDMPQPSPSRDRGYLGIILDQAEAAGVIEQVEKDKAAFRAGLKRGDVILAVQGRKVADAQALIGTIMSFRAGDIIKVKIKRDGEEKVLTATLDR